MNFIYPTLIVLLIASQKLAAFKTGYLDGNSRWIMYLFLLFLKRRDRIREVNWFLIFITERFPNEPRTAKGKPRHHKEKINGQASNYHHSYRLCLRMHPIRILSQQDGWEN